MKRLDLEDLKWVIVAAQHRSLHKAAEALHVRQSTLSRRLRDLEGQLGAELFERTKSGSHLTVAGRSFLGTARRITAEIDSAFVGIRSYGRGETGRLIIGTCASFSAGNLYATLADYRQRFPEVDLCIVDRVRDYLISDVAGNHVDIAVVLAKPDWSDQVLPLWAERIVAALPENHLFSARPFIRWSDLDDVNLIVSRRDPGPLFHKLLVARTVPLGRHIREHDVGIDHLLSLVGLGLGVAVVAEGAAGPAYPGVVFREIHDDGGPVRLAFFALWRRDNSNPTLKSFLDLLLKRYPDLSGLPNASKP